MAGGGAAVVVAAAARKTRALINAFLAAQATTPERATTAASLGVEEGVAWRRLRRNGILRQAQNSGWYVDMDALSAWENSRRWRVLVVLAVAVATLVAGLLQLAR
jgi:hypothetical protein